MREFSDAEGRYRYNLQMELDGWVKYLKSLKKAVRKIGATKNTRRSEMAISKFRALLSEPYFRDAEDCLLGSFVFEQADRCLRFLSDLISTIEGTTSPPAISFRASEIANAAALAIKLEITSSRAIYAAHLGEE